MSCSLAQALLASPLSACLTSLAFSLDGSVPYLEIFFLKIKKSRVLQVKISIFEDKDRMIVVQYPSVVKTEE